MTHISNSSSDTCFARMLEALSGFLERLFEDDLDEKCVDFESYERSLEVLNESLDQIDIVIDGREEERAEGLSSEDVKRNHMLETEEHGETDKNEEEKTDMPRLRAGERTHENTVTDEREMNERMRETRATHEKENSCTCRQL